MNWKIKLKKILKIGGAVFIVAVIAYNYISFATFDSNRQQIWGVTFSKVYAESIGMDWRQNLTALLDELKIKYYRIPIYWQEVEKTPGIYTFDDIDWQLEQIAARGGKVVAVVGWRQPRWPECHSPAWAKELLPEDRNAKIIDLITASVNRYKANPAIEAWQVENEPLLNLFGECPRADAKFLKSEIDLVRSLDNRPILVTASGELAQWFREAHWSDILGSTMYRSTWDQYLGYGSYWFLPASSYRVKAWIFGKQDINSFWISELQAEPWIPGGDATKVDLTEMYKTMSPEKLKKNLDYARRSNAARVYLWGAEWWYYSKIKLGTGEILDTVRKINW